MNIDPEGAHHAMLQTGRGRKKHVREGHPEIMTGRQKNTKNQTPTPRTTMPFQKKKIQSQAREVENRTYIS